MLPHHLPLPHHHLPPTETLIPNLNPRRRQPPATTLSSRHYRPPQILAISRLVSAPSSTATVRPPPSRVLHAAALPAASHFCHDANRINLHCEFIINLQATIFLVESPL
ncbi:hypothetical protein VIGAN_04177200 [Vigna angularis var. angularis]|uniref:Uncharacterized protein n=1 Tax=Vigna angularis var. angularis TaxID=157739 RepID=A0A0S3RUX0_PHAAN|nr:hypothetical protein VIGAN_04177200 [Vigna angularis var. angularis]